MSDPLIVLELSHFWFAKRAGSRLFRELIHSIEVRVVEFQS